MFVCCLFFTPGVTHWRRKFLRSCIPGFGVVIMTHMTAFRLLFSNSHRGSFTCIRYDFSNMFGFMILPLEGYDATARDSGNEQLTGNCWFICLRFVYSGKLKVKTPQIAILLENRLWWETCVWLSVDLGSRSGSWDLIPIWLSSKLGVGMTLLLVVHAQKILWLFDICYYNK